MSKETDDPALPEIGEGKRGEAGYLGYLLRQAAGSYRLRIERALADLGVTQPQFAVMTMLKSYPGQSNADIARLAMLTPQTTSVIIANLLRAGLVERRRHETHGRILQVALSAVGQALLETCRGRVLATERALVEGLGPSEEQILRRWLVHVARVYQPVRSGHLT